MHLGPGSIERSRKEQPRDDARNSGVSRMSQTPIHKARQAFFQGRDIELKGNIAVDVVDIIAAASLVQEATCLFDMQSAR